MSYKNLTAMAEKLRVTDRLESLPGDEITQYHCNAINLIDELQKIVNPPAEAVLDSACAHILSPRIAPVFEQVKRAIMSELTRGQEARLLWHPDAAATLNLVVRLNMLLSLLTDAAGVLRTVLHVSTNATKLYAQSGRVEPPVINLGDGLRPGQLAAMEAAKTLGLPLESIRDGSKPGVVIATN